MNTNSQKPVHSASHPLTGHLSFWSGYLTLFWDTSCYDTEDAINHRRHERHAQQMALEVLVRRTSVFRFSYVQSSCGSLGPSERKQVVGHLLVHGITVFLARYLLLLYSGCDVHSFCQIIFFQKKGNFIVLNIHTNATSGARGGW